MNSQNKLIALGYGRVSDPKQVDGFSLLTQRKTITASANSNGFELCKYFSDDGYSGRNINRPGYKKMMKYIDENNVNVIMVYKLDRFHRDETNLYNDLKKFKERGIRFIAIADGIDTADESTALLTAILSAIAANFSRNLSKLSWSGLYQAAQNCQFTGGKPPYGYIVDRDTMQMIPDPVTSLAVKTMFKLYAEGYSSNEICEWLSKNGYKTDQGNDFKPNSLNTIFHNERYCGIYTWNKATPKQASGKRNSHRYKDDYLRIEGGIPAIVSKDIFNAVQERLKKNAARASCNKTARYYPLTGFIKCSKCGASMCGGVSYSKGRPYYKYNCNKKCGNKPLRADYAEIFVLNAINQCLFSEPSRELIKDKLNKYSVDKSKEAYSEYHKLRCKISGLEKSQENFLRAIEKGNATNVITRRLERVSKQKEQAEFQITHLSKEAHTFTEEDMELLKARFTNYIQTKKNINNVEFLKSVIDSIEVDDDDVQVKFKSGISISKSTKIIMKGTDTMIKNITDYQDYSGILISVAGSQIEGNVSVKIGLDYSKKVWGYDTILDIDVPEEILFELMAEAEAEPAEMVGAPLTICCKINRNNDIIGIESFELTDYYGGIEYENC